jgi:hypothetical protein
MRRNGNHQRKPKPERHEFLKAKSFPDGTSVKLDVESGTLKTIIGHLPAISRSRTSGASSWGFQRFDMESNIWRRVGAIRGRSSGGDDDADYPFLRAWRSIVGSQHAFEGGSHVDEDRVEDAG